MNRREDQVFVWPIYTRIIHWLIAFSFTFAFPFSLNENLLNDYKIIRKELEKYSGDLVKKQEYIFLTKIDLITEKEVKKKIKELKKISANVLPVSIYNEESIEKVKKLLNKIKDKKTAV